MSLIVLFLAAMWLVFKYVLAPLEVRFTKSQPAVPLLAELAERELPPAALALITRNTKALRAAGFDPPLYFATVRMHGAFLAFYLNRGSGDGAICASMGAFSWLEFQTDFSSGLAIATSNSGVTPVFAPDPAHRIEPFPGVEDPAALYALHRARVVQEGHGSVVVPAPGAEIPFLVRQIAAPLENQAKLGTQWRDGDVYRPTLRGAFRSVLRHTAPTEWYFKRQLRQRVAMRRAELAAVQVPATPPYPVTIASASGLPSGAPDPAGTSRPTIERLAAEIAREQPRANRAVWPLLATMFVAGPGVLYLGSRFPVDPLLPVALSIVLLSGCMWHFSRRNRARWQRLGLLCHDCGKPLLGERSGFVANSGLCQHCGSIVAVAAPS